MNSLPASTRPDSFSDRLTPASDQRRPRVAGPARTAAGTLLSGLLGLWTQVQRHAALQPPAGGASVRDDSTGLPGRRALQEQLQAQFSGRTPAGPAARGRGQGQPTWSVLMIDLDHFGEVNDRHGPQAGNEVLRAVASALRAELRQSDLLGRWSGEAFLVLLPETAFEGALVAAERLRRAVSLHTFPYVGGLTLSIGAASCMSGDTPERVVARADAGAASARRDGRNRVAFTE